MTGGRVGGRVGSDRAPLTLERIDRAALGLVDGGGLRALTMRRLGAELGVEGMALYHHVRNKDALLDRLSDRVLAAVVVPAPTDGDWRCALLEFGRLLRAALLAHPRAISLIATRPVTAETGARLVGSMVPSLQAGGFEEGRAYLAIQSVAVFVLGHALAQAGADGEDLGEVPAAYYDEWFALGLEAMVAGLGTAPITRR